MNANDDAELDHHIIHAASHVAAAASTAAVRHSAPHTQLCRVGRGAGGGGGGGATS